MLAIFASTMDSRHDGYWCLYYWQPSLRSNTPGGRATSPLSIAKKIPCTVDRSATDLPALPGKSHHHRTSTLQPPPRKKRSEKNKRPLRGATPVFQMPALAIAPHTTSSLWLSLWLSKPPHRLSSHVGAAPFPACRPLACQARLMFCACPAASPGRHRELSCNGTSGRRTARSSQVFPADDH